MKIHIKIKHTHIYNWADISLSLSLLGAEQGGPSPGCVTSLRYLLGFALHMAQPQSAAQALAIHVYSSDVPTSSTCVGGRVLGFPWRVPGCPRAVPGLSSAPATPLQDSPGVSSSLGVSQCH